MVAWPATVKDLDLQFYRPYAQVMDLYGRSAVGAVVRRRAVRTTSTTRSINTRRARTREDRADLGGRRRRDATLTYRALWEETNRLAGALARSASAGRPRRHLYADAAGNGGRALRRREDRRGRRARLFRLRGGVGRHAPRGCGSGRADHRGWLSAARQAGPLKETADAALADVPVRAAAWSSSGGQRAGAYEPGRDHGRHASSRSAHRPTRRWRRRRKIRA